PFLPGQDSCGTWHIGALPGRGPARCLRQRRSTDQVRRQWTSRSRVSSAACDAFPANPPHGSLRRAVGSPSIDFVLRLPMLPGLLRFCNVATQLTRGSVRRGTKLEGMRFASGHWSCPLILDRWFQGASRSPPDEAPFSFPHV